MIKAKSSNQNVLAPNPAPPPQAAAAAPVAAAVQPDFANAASDAADLAVVVAAVGLVQTKGLLDALHSA